MCCLGAEAHAHHPPLVHAGLDRRLVPPHRGAKLRYNVAHYVAKRQFDVITYVANYVAKGLRSRAAIFRSAVFLNRDPVDRHALATPFPAFGWYRVIANLRRTDLGLICPPKYTKEINVT